jgi:3-phenylpropionate/cinnamic acid dioxygenase small subunit
VKLSRDEAEAFLVEEARMLDDGLFNDWLHLFASDGIYWLPIVDDSDPTREPSLIYDDAKAREQRVYALTHSAHYAQRPPSRTVRFISNVHVEAGANGADQAVVRSNLLVLEVRPGDRQQVGLAQQRFIGARCEYRLQDQGAWKILLKKVLLADRDVPLLNLTFIV